jgi:hypothetical protein
MIALYYFSSKTRFANIFGTSIPEPTMRPNPVGGGVWLPQRPAHYNLCGQRLDNGVLQPGGIIFQRLRPTSGPTWRLSHLMSGHEHDWTTGSAAVSKLALALLPAAAGIQL